MNKEPQPYVHDEWLAGQRKLIFCIALACVILFAVGFVGAALVLG